MNMKSYLRGIGAGMIVTALVMGVSSGSKMTDAEILRRAQEIQKNESVVLSQMEEDSNSSAEETVSVSKEDVVISSVENESSTELSVSEEVSDNIDVEDAGETDETDEHEDTGSDENNNNIEETAPTEEDTPGETVKEPEKINPLPDGEDGFTHNENSVEIIIIKGDSSVSVSRRMYEAGLVESAVDFDKYLCSNGYDKSISVGTYEIAYGLDYEDMAKIISRRK